MASKIALVLSSGLLLPTMAETILGVTVFSRHGDRTSKHYAGYSLTNLGFQQNHQAGDFYRSTYLSRESPKRILGISENKYTPSQIFASAPDQMVLLNTATAFLQGLYPPLESLDAEVASQTLNNGTSYTNPLNGYQYVVLHGEEATSPDTIWIKGDESCPAATASAAEFEQSTEFQTRVSDTKSFYESFWQVLSEVYDYSPANLSYENAYDIFDLINVASIHNASVVEGNNVTAAQLFQLRTLADSAEFGLNYNASSPGRAIGGQTLAGAVFKQLNQTVSSKGKLKFSLLAGSYDTFLAFFGLAGLTSVDGDFFGLPDYASTMAFELFTDAAVNGFPPQSDLKVRFLFRNGSDEGAELKAWPMFGKEKEDMTWSEFENEMKEKTILSVEDWCGACNSTQTFCLPYLTEASGAETQTSQNKKDGMSNAVAGVIGAVVTLGVVGACGLVWFLLKRKRTNIDAERAEKASQGGSSISS